MFELLLTVDLVQFNTWILLSILLFLLYLYSTRNHNYWKKRGMLGPKPKPVIGNQFDALFSSSLEIERRNYAKYGKVYGYFEGNKPVLMVSDPALIKLITVKDWHHFINRRQTILTDSIFSENLLGLKDDKWKKVRSIVSPTFTSGKIRKMLDLMKDCLTGLLEKLENAANQNEEVDVKRLFGAYTMDVIASCAFATKTNAHKNPDDPFIKNAMQLSYVHLTRLLQIVFLPTFVRKALDIDVVPNGIKTFFKEVSYHILTQRKTNNQSRNDFVQLLVDAENSSLKDNIQDINGGLIINENNGELETNIHALTIGSEVNRKLTDAEAVAQMMLFFVAGYETTGTLLSLCAYCLALNIDKQDILYDELRREFQNKSDISYEDINHLEYLNAVVSETLRLYPPVYKADRAANKDYKVEGMDFTIPKGIKIMLGLYNLHHVEEYFQEPELFKPERFLKENMSKIKPYTYLPFGAGPRNCVAMRFALAEAKLALIKVLLEYKLVPSKSTKIPLKYSFHPFLTQAKDVHLAVEKRLNIK